MECLHFRCWEKEEIFTLDCGDEAARWISRYIHETNTGLRIGYHSGEEQRDIRKPLEEMMKIYKKLNNDGTVRFCFVFVVSTLLTQLIVY